MAAKKKVAAKKPAKKEELSVVKKQVNVGRWSGAFDIDYDNYRPSGACDGDCGICRCSRITNIRVTDVNPIRLIPEFVEYDKCSEQFKYFVKHLFTHFDIDENSIEVSTMNGYYGEEIGRVELEYGIVNDLLRQLRRHEKSSIKEIVEATLENEYGFVLPTLSKLKWTIEEIPVDRINIGKEEYMRKISKDDLKKFNETELPIGIYVDEGVDGYRLIDGYHRYIQNVINKKGKNAPKTVKVFVGR